MALSSVPFERDCAVDRAYGSIIDTVAELNLRLEIREEYRTLNVSHVAIVDRVRGSEFFGSGKGPHHRLGAIAEALEHRFSQMQRSGECDELEAEKLSLVAASLADPILLAVSSFRKQAVICTTMRCSETGEDFSVPIQLINPDAVQLDYDSPDVVQFLGRYSTNSGTALGLSKDEAFIHSVNELFERHFLSLLFHQLVYGEGDDFFLLGKLSDEWLRGIAGFSIEDIEEDAFVIVAQKDGIYFCCLIEEAVGYSSLSKIGSGASTCPVHAIERAIWEFIQTIALEDRESIEDDADARSFLLSSRKLQELIHCQEGAFFPKATRSWATPALNQGTREIVANLRKGLLRDRRALVRITPIGSLGVVVCQSYIPSLERFHLIRRGNMVAPLRAFGHV